MMLFKQYGKIFKYHLIQIANLQKDSPESTVC